MLAKHYYANTVQYLCYPLDSSITTDVVNFSCFWFPSESFNLISSIPFASNQIIIGHGHVAYSTAFV